MDDLVVTITGTALPTGFSLDGVYPIKASFAGTVALAAIKLPVR